MSRRPKKHSRRPCAGYHSHSPNAFCRPEVLAEYFLARAGVGFAPVVDRHNLVFHARPRLEIGACFRSAHVVPLLGAGAFTLNRSPAAYGLTGIGWYARTRWQLGFDVRAGAFWDQDAARDGRTIFGEGQFRVGKAFM